MINRHESARALAFIKDLAKQHPPRSIGANEKYQLLLGFCYEMLKQYDSAELHTLEAVSFTKKLQQLSGPIFKGYADYQLGELYFQMGRYSKAKKHFRQYLKKRPDGVSLQITLNVYELLARMDSLSGDYPSFARHLQNVINLQKSNLNIQGQRQAEELAVRYETERKEQQIAMLQQADQLRRSDLRHTLFVQRMTIAGIFVLLLIAGLLVRQNRQRKKMNRLIEQKNDVITGKNEALVKVLAEKEWLLKEVNHRVKNNLQTVISLLETQGKYLKNEALEAIVSSQHRVYAMLLLHQKLSQAEDNNTIEISGYLDDIIQYLRESFDDPEAIRWHLDLQPLRVGLRQAVPIALIVNESVTNVLKHAFPAAQEGDIAIRLRHEKDQVFLSISDNGVGLRRSAGPATPELPDDPASTSLGIGLIRGLSRELRGNMQICSENGTTVSVRFGIHTSIPVS
jgi:two-component sensor histidine kinase